MTLERFKAATGANVVHIPYRSGGQAHIVAIASVQRSQLAPDVATFIEGGVKDFTAASYIGILAPSGTPAPVIAQLQKAIAGGLNGGGAADRLRGMGSEIATPEQMTPDGFAAFIRIDYERMREAAKLAGIEPK
jgi:tripartite-type tricarboxylate transporter receptor subunit TctC